MHQRARHLARLLLATVALLAVATVAVAALEHTVGVANASSVYLVAVVLCALLVVVSPYRALIGPLLAYLDVLERAWPPDREAPITFVVIPEYVARHWWERILYNQSARRLPSVLLGRPHTVVVDVPYRRDDPADEDH